MNHRDLIYIAQELGYNQISNDGLCNGFSMMWIQAVCNNGLKEFNNRLILLSEFVQNPGKLKDEIEHVRDLVKNQEDLTQRDEAILEIPAFFEGVLLYQEPGKLEALFNAKLTQFDRTIISSYTRPISATNGELHTKTSYNVYNQESLVNHLNELVTQLEGQTDVGINFGSTNHSVSARYLGQGNFEFIDTNFNTNISSPLQSKIINTKELGEQLRQSFQSTRVDDLLIIRTTAVSGSAELIEKINLGSNNAISKLIPDAVSGKNLLMIAISRKDEELYNRIELDQVDINALDNTGRTALHDAAEYNEGKLDLLLKKGARPTICDKYNQTPLYFAVAGNKINAVKTLLEHDKTACNIRRPLSSGGISPLNLACRKPNDECKKELITLLLPHSKLNMDDIKKGSPMFQAMQICSSEIQKKFIEEGLKAYISQREEENQFFSDALNLGFGYTKEEKKVAAQNLLAHINNFDIKLTSSSIAVLKDGRLAELYNFFQSSDIANKPPKPPIFDPPALASRYKERLKDISGYNRKDNQDEPSVDLLKPR